MPPAAGTAGTIAWRPVGPHPSASRTTVVSGPGSAQGTGHAASGGSTSATTSARGVTASAPQRAEATRRLLVAIQQYRAALNEERKLPHPPGWSGYCWDAAQEGQEPGGCNATNEKWSGVDLSDFVQQQYEQQAEQQLDGDTNKHDALLVAHGLIGAWEAAVARKETQLAALLDVARARFDVAADRGVMRDVQASRSLLQKLLEERRATDGSWQIRILSGLNRLTNAAAFALDVTEGMSVPRAAARAGGRLAGAELGVEASGACGEGAPVCGVFLVPIGSIEGAHAVDAVVNKVALTPVLTEDGGREAASGKLKT